MIISPPQLSDGKLYCRGIMSEAMVMCASTPDKVEILAPPPGSKPGDLVLVDGFTRRPDDLLNPKKKIFESCAPDLKVNDLKQATYKVRNTEIKYCYIYS